MTLGRSLSEAAQGLRRNVNMTFAAVLTVAVSLSLLGMALLVRGEVDLIRQYFYTQVEVSIFLDPEVTPEQRTVLGGELKSLPVVEKVIYESKDEAYRRFRLQYRSNPDLIANVTATALPESYRVSLTDARKFNEIADQFQHAPGVAQVVDQRDVLNRLFSVLDGFRDAALSLAAVILIAATLLIGNVVRVSAYNRRRETSLMRLVGASRTYIQLPFVLEGLLSGTVGTVVAFGMLVATKTFLLDRTLHAFFTSGLLPTVTWPRLLELGPILLAVSLLITGLASFVTTLRHVKA